MNIKNIKLGPWSALAYSSYATALTMGFYGKTRMSFSSDFIYNKYHFGVLTNLIAGGGFYLTAKHR